MLLVRVIITIMRIIVIKMKPNDDARESTKLIKRGFLKKGREKGVKG